MSTTNRLTALAIKSLKPGFHADGGGLYLRVTATRKSWSFIYHRDKRRREMGLGSFVDVPLAEARVKAADARTLIHSGVDPLSEKARSKSQGRTFRDAAAEYIALKELGWSNPKHRQQWPNSLRDHAKPIMDVAVDQITTQDVLTCLRPIWHSKPETSSRVRMRIENILDAEKARGHRSGDNPAAWKGNLAHLLPPRSKLSRGHQRALDYKKAPAFMAALRQREGVAAKALEFTVLNAVRTSETLHATWGEIDWESRVWTVPAERTKTKTELRVALSDAAVAVVSEMKALGCEWVFPNANRDGPLSTAAMSAVLDRMDMKADATVHGFRSTFRDWAGEATEFPRDIVEMALGHKVGSAVERAYRRGDALERRRAVMEAWASHLSEKD